MRKKLRKSFWLSVGVLPFLLTACQMVPVEEELPAAPVMQSYEIEEYQLTTVKRGDIFLEKTVRCEYIPANREMLGFMLGGEYIDQVFVAEGQTVQKGELLAELVTSDLEQRIDTQEYTLETLRLKEQQARELWALDLARLEAAKADFSLISETDEKYYLQVQELEDAVYIEKMKLADLKEELNKRRLYAGINGTVTYLRQTKNGDRSVEGQLFMTLADMDSVAFVVKGEDAVYFPIGTQTLIRCNSKEYQAVAVEPERLGLKGSDTGEPVAYLQLMQPDPTIEDGTTAMIKVVMEASQDTLYLEKKALRSADGKYYVAVMDEEGWKVTKEVSTGLITTEYIEITGGLEEGSLVIIE